VSIAVVASPGAAKVTDGLDKYKPFQGKMHPK
jgi:hypothetical protein